MVKSQDYYESFYSFFFISILVSCILYQYLNYYFKNNSINKKKSKNYNSVYNRGGGEFVLMNRQSVKTPAVISRSRYTRHFSI